MENKREGGLVYELKVEPLRQDQFLGFGSVIETEGRSHTQINDGRAKRFDALADVQVLDRQGHPAVSVFEASPITLPFHVRTLERHPLGSQTFIPLSRAPFLVVVSDAKDEIPASSVRAFLTNGEQGVHYNPGVWHHSLLVLGERQKFVVIDRVGPGDNCDEAVLDAPLAISSV